MTVLALPHGKAFRDEEHAEGNLEKATRDGKGHADVVAEDLEDRSYQEDGVPGQPINRQEPRRQPLTQQDPHSTRPPTPTDSMPIQKE